MPGYRVPAGGLYTKVAYPPGSPGAIQEGPGSKRGTATAQSYVGLIATGDCSVEAAAKNAGITKIGTVDQEVTLILGGLYMSVTTIVTGD